MFFLKKNCDLYKIIINVLCVIGTCTLQSISSRVINQKSNMVSSPYTCALSNNIELNIHPIIYLFPCIIQCACNRDVFTIINEVHVYYQSLLVLSYIVHIYNFIDCKIHAKVQFWYIKLAQISFLKHDIIQIM